MEAELSSTNASMGTSLMKIRTILDQIDLGSMALPEFQRGYVWNRDQVRGLMQSLYRKHPVGSLLLWETRTKSAWASGDGRAAGSAGPGRGCAPHRTLAIEPSGTRPSEFVHVRPRGPDQHHLYAGSYPDDDLRWWAERIREWSAQGREPFIDFNNDGHVQAVRDAGTPRAMLGREGHDRPP
jgi:hypothetical protein